MRHAWGMSLLFVMGTLGTAQEAVAGLESRAQNFLGLPLGDVSVGARVGDTGGHDEDAWAWGGADGELVLIFQENRLLWAATSTDSGATFAPEILVNTNPGDGPVDRFWAAPVGDTIHLVYLVGAAGGDTGLSYRRSTDMGRTWSVPVPVVTRGDLQHGVVDARFDADASGRMIVTFKERWEGQDVWVRTSSDQGASWTAPVRLDSGDAAGAWPSELGDVLVGADGTLHAAFVQYRGVAEYVWYTRSTDGGVTFAPEVNFNALAPSLGSADPDLARAADGGILLTYWDYQSNGSINVLRSVNGGASFSLTIALPVSSGFTSVQPRLYPAPSGSVVLLAFDFSGLVKVLRSTDSAASFGPPVTASFGVAEHAYRMVRTSAGNWVIAYTSSAEPSGIYAQLGISDGITWFGAVRADLGGTDSESDLRALTAVGTDTAFLAYVDFRNSVGTQVDVFAADSPAASLNFSGRERRVDTDHSPANLFQYPSRAIASDGGSNVYVAVSAARNGPRPEIFVTRSSDAGKTFASAVQVSTHDPSSFLGHAPVLEAFPDGRVFLLYLRESAAGARAVLFQRSLDFGATWDPPVEIASGAINAWEYEIAATPSAVLVVYSLGNVLGRRSTDGGATFGPAQDLDGATSSSSVFSTCVQGNRMVLVYRLNDANGGSVWGRRSTDAGATWGTATELRPAAVNGDVALPNLACDAGTTAVAAWVDARSGTYRLYTNRLSDSTWSGERALGGAAGSQVYPSIAFAGTGVFVLAYDDWVSTVSSARSTDGGTNWDVPARRDDAAPQPLALSGRPIVASDGAGNVWLAWLDSSAGELSLAVRVSSDAGANFGLVRRVDGWLPQGASRNDFPAAAALPGVGMFAWMGWRSSSYWDTRVNSWDTLDLDRDGSGDAVDCDDERTDVYPGAPEVCDGIANDCNAPGWPAVPANEGDDDLDSRIDCADNCPLVSNPSQSNLDGDALGDACDPDRDGDGVDNVFDCAPDNPQEFGPRIGEVGVATFEKNATSTPLSWPAVGGAVGYDVARDSLSRLRSIGTGGATGVSCGQAGTTYDETTNPKVNVGFYYLVRARNACGPGSYGSGSSGVERAGPCP